jgi:hypothetical protein
VTSAEEFTQLQQYEKETFENMIKEVRLQN